MKTRIVAWWSGGIASALACHWAIQTLKDVAVVFIDTKNEHPDTYRFLLDCEKLYKQPIERLSRIGSHYKSIEDVWDRFLMLNSATGAICSSELKRAVREEYQNINVDYAQVFGFDVTERKRHLNMQRNYPEINIMSPLIEMNWTKSQVVAIFKELGVEIPIPYKLGYRNNNCWMTGCVQGGIGYWQKIKRDEPEKFNAMAAREHRITNLKGKPVTMLKDRTDGKEERLFLIAHPDYPDIKNISMVKGREPEPLMECNGFCSTV